MYVLLYSKLYSVYFRSKFGNVLTFFLISHILEFPLNSFTALYLLGFLGS